MGLELKKRGGEGKRGGDTQRKGVATALLALRVGEQDKGGVIEGNTQ